MMHNPKQRTLRKPHPRPIPWQLRLAAPRRTAGAMGRSERLFARRCERSDSPRLQFRVEGLAEVRRHWPCVHQHREWKPQCFGLTTFSMEVEEDFNDWRQIGGQAMRTHAACCRCQHVLDQSQVHTTCISQAARALFLPAGWARHLFRRRRLMPEFLPERPTPESESWEQISLHAHVCSSRFVGCVVQRSWEFYRLTPPVTRFVFWFLACLDHRGFHKTLVRRKELYIFEDTLFAQIRSFIDVLVSHGR